MNIPSCQYLLAYQQGVTRVPQLMFSIRKHTHDYHAIHWSSEVIEQHLLVQSCVFFNRLFRIQRASKVWRILALVASVSTIFKAESLSRHIRITHQMCPKGHLLDTYMEHDTTHWPSIIQATMICMILCIIDKLDLLYDAHVSFNPPLIFSIASIYYINPSLSFVCIQFYIYTYIQLSL